MQNVGDTSAGRGNCRTRPVGLARVSAPIEHYVHADCFTRGRTTRISGEIKMIHAWWLPQRDIDPLVKKQLQMTTNMLSVEHRVGEETAKEFLNSFKETQVQGSVLRCPKDLLRKRKKK